ncbi:hypothetical protein VQ03_27350 [Methylobacterium tarhaniae]|uniref:Uncharacterized protein n=1 Tax=Methylobacterium tarhaniae TaxID=1187852 RepID=A0A0J6SC59_9HYPH|nr:hypothetical protein [Methylobacterium tarhaniae]KMO31312.1 hypothetical protein VQ03_27350 [Methylobacterium tarhaniae]
MPPLPRLSPSPILVSPRPAPILDTICRFELACIARTMVGAGFIELLPMALLTAPRASDVVTTGRQQ